ncbi:MAG: hypothetical protein J3Q66DRAFT_330211 [Benniella sp.]|nr:MAG: hypothetical protein J3Q66DRAFT_330211 [Benniella sp.]
MARRPAVAMPSNKSTLSGNARPFVPSHRQPFFSTASSSKTPPERHPRSKDHRHPLPTLPLDSITQAVCDNNAFLLGKNILTAYESLDVYNKALDSGSVNAVQETMASALRKHPDPAMFVVNALITVGTVAVIKDMDSDFELAISELLINVMDRYLQWHHHHPHERAQALKMGYTSSSAKRAPTPAVLSGFHLESQASSQVEDLILLDEQPILKRSRPRLPSPQAYVAPSTFNLLDDDLDSPTLMQLAVLKPVVPDLLKLSISDGPESASGPSTVVTTPMLSSSSSSVSSTHGDDGYLLTDDSELEQDNVIVEVDLQELDKAKQRVLDRRGPQKLIPHHKQDKFESVIEDLLDIIDHPPRADDNERRSSDGDDAAEEPQGNDIPMDTPPIQQYHREKLLQEILNGKHALQMYSAIEVLGMQADLLKPVNKSTETYGWVLARELYKRGRFRESSVVVFEYLQSHPNPTPPNSLSTPRPSPLFVKKSTPTMSPSLEPFGTQLSGRVAPPFVPSSSSPKSTQAVLTPLLPLSLPPKPPMETEPFYQLPSNTKVVFVDSITQLKTMSASLKMSKVIGMDTEWLPQIEAFEEHQPKNSRTAILQLACDADSTVFIVDTIAFLQNNDHGQSLVNVIGDVFNNPKILKIAYDWDGDHDLLLATFPMLFQEKYRPRNLMDLKYLCFKTLQDHLGRPPSGPTRAVEDAPRSSSPQLLILSSPSSPVSSSSSLSLTLATPAASEVTGTGTATATGTAMGTAMGTGTAAGPGTGPGTGTGAGAGAVTAPATATTPERYILWSAYPSIKGMHPIPGGLSGMLIKLCGWKLNKSQRLSHWEQRPLTEDQLLYAASDAWCLLDIYEKLEGITRV